ncbi:MAG: FtsX-like permease family protein [Flavobacteriales bacterium]|nr:FtsX-like permease family protein [Flavobacteriales bacterium]
MKVPFFISKRYLFSKKSRNIINLISGISIFVVACVTAAMICILSAFNGIESLVGTLFTTFDAEISITPEKGKVFEVDEAILASIASIPEAEKHSLILEDDVIVRYGGQPSVATIMGVSSNLKSITSVATMMRAGEYLLERNDMACAIPGLGIQSELGIPYDISEFPVMSISAPIRGKKLSKYKEKALNTKPILVSGVFSVNAELDVKYLLTPLYFAQDLLGYDQKTVSRIDVGLTPDSDTEDIKKRLQVLLGDELKVETRYDKNSFIHKTNQTEKWATFVILTFILVIAAFNVMASLTMLIIEKKKDIFILKSIGMTDASIFSIFTWQGILINAVGALIGMVIGLLLCFLQIKFGLIELQGSIVDHYPMEVRGIDLLQILFTVMGIGTVFSAVMVKYLVKRFRVG